MEVCFSFFCSPFPVQFFILYVVFLPPFFLSPSSVQSFIPMLHFLPSFFFSFSLFSPSFLCLLLLFPFFSPFSIHPSFLPSFFSLFLHSILHSFASSSFLLSFLFPSQFNPSFLSLISLPRPFPQLQLSIPPPRTSMHHLAQCITNPPPFHSFPLPLSPLQPSQHAIASASITATSVNSPFLLSLCFFSLHHQYVSGSPMHINCFPILSVSLFCYLSICLSSS